MSTAKNWSFPLCLVGASITFAVIIMAIIYSIIVQVSVASNPPPPAPYYEAGGEGGLIIVVAIFYAIFVAVILLVSLSLYSAFKMRRNNANRSASLGVLIPSVLIGISVIPIGILEWTTIADASRIGLESLAVGCALGTIGGIIGLFDAGKMKDSNPQYNIP